MKLSNKIERKIETYKAGGGLDHTARVFLALCGINHPEVKQHVERVALLTEAAAIRTKKDPKAAFFAGLLHDIGKLVLPSNLFDGHNIDREEYETVKTHAVAGFEALKGFHSFTALCAGLHHSLYRSGYGLDVSDFPEEWNPATIKKVLEISTIVSISDFTDAFSNRKTKIKTGETGSLKEMLKKKYLDDHALVDIVLEENKKIQEIK